MKSQRSYEAVDRIVQRQLERKTRLDVVRTAERSLLPDEREEFFTDLILKLGSARPSTRSASRWSRSTGPAPVTVDVPVAVESSQPKPSMRALITTVLAGDVALGSGDVCRAVMGLAPNLQRASIASELTKMRAAGLVIKKGLGPRGGLYGLADAPAEADSTPR
jgi:hypothetical protein